MDLLLRQQIEPRHVSISTLLTVKGKECGWPSKFIVSCKKDKEIAYSDNFAWNTWICFWGHSLWWKFWLRPCIYVNANINSREFIFEHQTRKPQKKQILLKLILFGFPTDVHRTLHSSANVWAPKKHIKVFCPYLCNYTWRIRKTMN